MTPHIDWERFTVPSNHVWSVKKDETTGGYEAIVDIKRPVEMAISHAVAERTEEIRKRLDKYYQTWKDPYARSFASVFYDEFSDILSSLIPQETEERKEGV